MNTFFNISGTTYSFADISSVSEIETYGGDGYPLVSRIKIRIGGQDEIIIGFVDNQNHEKYEKSEKVVNGNVSYEYVYKYSTDPVKDMTTLREKLLEGWANFKKSVTYL